MNPNIVTISCEQSYHLTCDQDLIDKPSRWNSTAKPNMMLNIMTEEGEKTMTGRYYQSMVVRSFSMQYLTFFFKYWSRDLCRSNFFQAAATSEFVMETKNPRFSQLFMSILRAEHSSRSRPGRLTEWKPASSATKMTRTMKKLLFLLLMEEKVEDENMGR